MTELARLINNEKLIAQALSSLSPLNTKVLDEVYPASRRIQHPFAQIGIQEISETTQTVPVVRRGAPGVPVSQEAGSVTYIEPQPIRIEDSIGAREANDIKVLGSNWQEFLRNKLDIIRRKVRATTEALAAQSLTGKIQYPMLMENGAYTTYEVDFTRGGANPVKTYTPSVLWDDSSVKLSDIVRDLIAMTEMLEQDGYGGNLKIWAGNKAYTALMDIVLDAKVEKKITASVNQNKVNIAGFEIERVSHTYANPQTGASVKVVPDNKILIFDANAPFTLYYLAIDHFKAGLKATPLFVYSYEAERGDALKIFAESKPLPCPVVKAILWATVTS